MHHRVGIAPRDAQHMPACIPEGLQGFGFRIKPQTEAFVCHPETTA